MTAGWDEVDDYFAAVDEIKRLQGIDPASHMAAVIKLIRCVIAGEIEQAADEMNADSSGWRWCVAEDMYEAAQIAIGPAPIKEATP